MNIKHPEFLLLLLLVPAFIFFLNITWKKRKKALDVLCDPSQLGKLFPASSKAKVLLRYFMLSLAFILFTVSLISPRWGYDWREIETKGTNIFIALDVSKSMLADDIKPNRLTRAKGEIVKFIDRLRGDTVGVIIFAGEAFMQAPLTHDYLMVKDWIAQIRYGSVPVEGTSIKALIKEAMKGFAHVKSDTKTLIIVSDGEEHDEETVKMAKRAKASGIKIYAIGIGTLEGTPIPYNGALVKDEEGNIVLSKLNDTFLKEIAEETGGHYVRSTTGDFHLDTLYYNYIRQDQNAETLKTGKSKLWYETYQIFAGIAFLLLLLELLMTFDWRIFNFKKLFRKKRKNKVFLLPLIFSLLSTAAVEAAVLDPDVIKGDRLLQNNDHKKALESYLNAQVKDPHDPRLNYNLGISFYREAKYQKAIKSFKLSAKYANDLYLKEQAFYNLGNALFKLKEYEDALEAYKQAHKLIPEDLNAEFNYELTKRLLDQPEDEEEKEDDKEDKDEKDKDQNKDQDKQDKDKQDQKDKEKQEQDKKKQQQEQEKRQDIENLLKQTQEANSNKVNQQRMQQQQGEKGGAGMSGLHPW